MILKEGAVYEHVKTGNHYRLLYCAKAENTLAEMVVYESLSDNKVSKIWVRSKEEFLGEAISPDGTMHPRFRLVE